VALVDELAHTNIPGSRNEKRWQDVEELLAAGIDVISTVNAQHLESLNDVVERITGIRQRETVPDAMVRAADQIELVDMHPEALRRRMAHGNIYAAEKIDAALSNYFRVGNLTALRELALLWLADRVDEGLQRYRSEHGITRTWEARERVVVALSGGPEGRTLIRRAARIAARSAGGDLLAVHVTSNDQVHDGREVRLAIPDTLPEVLADPGLLERVVANLVANAVRHAPPGKPPSVTASALNGQVQLRVVDRGPGIAEADRERVFLPFQRRGDRDGAAGVGLGLALSRGLTEAMGGTLVPEETPGGGLTMVVTLPAAASPSTPDGTHDDPPDGRFT
jgi:two-component system, OmpR family, sensor histidine kinase KdpD